MFYAVLLYFNILKNNLYNLLKQNDGNNSRDFELVSLGYVHEIYILKNAQILKIFPGSGPYFEYDCFGIKILEIHISFRY